MYTQKFLAIFILFVIIDNIKSAHIKRPELEKKILEAEWRLQDYLGKDK